MDKQCIIQYQADFDKIAHFINSEDNREQVEGWFKEKKRKEAGNGMALLATSGLAQWRVCLVG